jgi:ubiquinone/menaquinone biosynthesis C-methylase UbiE
MVQPDANRTEPEQIEELMPPREKIFVGGGDFRAIGQQFLEDFIKIGGLKLNEKVLDVGCGIGRMAIPLTKYMQGHKGEYEGIDIVQDGIEWCRENITSKYPNFRFRHVDIYNSRYNPEGKSQASNFRFPYQDGTFDFVFLTSVFTHMLPDDMENYIHEIVRVLRSGGRCLITFFLLNDESLRLLGAGQSSTQLTFRHAFGVYRTNNQDVPEAVVAYDENFVLGLYDKYGLAIQKPIHYGSWCGRKQFLRFQDIVVAVKE